MYHADHVPNGIYESIRELKMEPENVDPDIPDLTDEYQYILDICRARQAIPVLSIEDAEKTLKTLKKSVNDFFSITALHFVNAGYEGVVHFRFLLNSVISSINLSGISELNTIYASILYKGHQKDKSDP